MKKKHIFLLFFLYTHSLISMEKQSKPPEFNLEGSQMWESVALTASQAWPSMSAQLYNPSNELNKEYRDFLVYISGRVDQVERELKECKNPARADWQFPVSYLWSATKYYVRSVETLLKDPESEKQAQALLSKIKIAHQNKRDGLESAAELCSENQELVTQVRGKIDEIYNRYSSEISLPIKAQIAYLVEYEGRIRRVDEAMGQGFDL